MSARPGNDRRNTSCIVHELLEKQDGVPAQQHDQSYEGLAQERLVDKDPHSNAEATQHSRLLTKKQISDMAFGIRELSKKLSQIRLKLHVKNIFILGKAHDESLIKNTRETVEWLLMKDPKYKVYVEHTLEDNKVFDKKSLLDKDASYEGRLKFWTNELAEEKPQMFDIVLAVSLPEVVLREKLLTLAAWWRRDCTVLILALSTRCAACPRVLSWVTWLPHEVRF
jgi:NAD+ kinase